MDRATRPRNPIRDSAVTRRRRPGLGPDPRLRLAFRRASWPPCWSG